MSTGAVAALAAYASGEISAEIALMRVLLTLGSVPAALDWLEGSGQTALLRMARAHRDGLDRIAQLIAAGLVADRTGLAALREQFDRAAALAPEAAVALYALGSPQTLDRATAEIVERLRQWQLLSPNIAVLDIGCGIGRIERAVAPHVGTIVGIDLSPAMIAAARQRCAGIANAEFLCCDGADLSALAGRRFGLVLAVDCFPYLVAADPAGEIAARHVADAAALLDPGGALAIFNYSYRGNLAADKDDIARLAASAGLAVERHGTRDFALWDGTTFLLRKTKIEQSRTAEESGHSPSAHVRSSGNRRRR